LREQLKKTNDFIKKISEQENVSEEEIKKIIIDSFVKAYEEEAEDPELIFDLEDDFLVYRAYKIVKKVENKNREITLAEAEQKKGILRSGFLLILLEAKKFPPKLNNIIRTKLKENLNNINREEKIKTFKNMQKTGDLIKGTIKNIQQNYYQIELSDNSIGYWDKKEWYGKDSPRFGKVFYFVVKELQIDEERKTERIILTRDGELLTRKALENNVPEIKSGLITIKKIIRTPGFSCKVLVEGNRSCAENPLGPCIGKDGVRIAAIREVLGMMGSEREKLVLVKWSDNVPELVFNLLAPINVFSFLERGDSWDIVIRRSKSSFLMENDQRMIKKIGEAFEKKINVKIYEDIIKKKNYINICNGNVDFSEDIR